MSGPIELGFALYTPSVHMPDLGGVDLFRSGPWYQEWTRLAAGLAVDSRSDAILGAFPNEWGLTLDFAASTASGGNSHYTIPVCVVSPDCPRISIPVDWLAYGGQSDPGPYPMPPEVQELYPYSAANDSDHDLFVLVTNSDQTDITDIYEYYNIYFLDNLADISRLDLTMLVLPPRHDPPDGANIISLARVGTDLRFRFSDGYNVARVDTTGAAYIATLPETQRADAQARINVLMTTLNPLWGTTSIPRDQELAVLRQAIAAFQLRLWVGAGVARFDLTTGYPRPEGWTSASAGGLSKFQGCVRYDEVARGRIPHALRLCVDAGNTSTKFVYPARHAVTGWNPNLGLPMGARISIRPDWYAANQSRYPGQDGVILRALLEYGGIVDDIETSGTFGIVALTGITDDGWHQNELLNLRTIPRSAFRVHKLEPGYTIEAPARVQLGESFQVTFRAQPPGKQNFIGNLYYTWGDQSGAALLSDQQPVVTTTLVARKVGVQELIQQPYPDWYHAPPVMIEVVDPNARPSLPNPRPPWMLPGGRAPISHRSRSWAGRAR